MLFACQERKLEMNLPVEFELLFGICDISEKLIGNLTSRKEVVLQNTVFVFKPIFETQLVGKEE